MLRSIFRLTLSVSVLSALLVLATCTLGIFQPSTEIAFVCDFESRNLYAQLCLTDADRGLIVQLTNNQQMMVSNIAWSPDGNQIVFQARRYNELAPSTTDAYEYGLFLIDPSAQAITVFADNAEGPAWSPDGTQIAFNTTTVNQPWIYSDLYSIVVSRNFLRFLVDIPQSVHNPTWSPDGTQLAFQAADTPYVSPSAIYRVDADGTDLHLVVPPDSTYVDPAWSPDGSKLAFSWSGNWDRDIVVLDLNTGVRQNLTANFSGKTAYDGSPSWSPDGKRIAFDSDVSRGFWQPPGFWLYVMNADGSGAYIVAQGRRPAWRPPRVFSRADWVR